MIFDPIHQFEIHDLVPLFKLAGRQIHFTNSAFYMFVSVALTWPSTCPYAAAIFRRGDL